MKKHILVYSQYFYPEQFRINDICLELVSRGHKVSVVTGIPNYPAGNFFNGYDWKNKRNENWNGIEIYRMPIFPRGSNKFSLSLNYLSFVIAAKFLEKNLPQSADLVFTYEVSPITQALPAIWYAKKYKLNHLLYVMDLWPENVVAITNLKNKWLMKPIDAMVNYIYKHSSLILTSSQSFVESISKRNINKTKIMYWPQYAEDIYNKKLKNNTEVEVEKFNEKTFVFAGNIGEAQGLEILIEASKILKKETIEVKFIIIGDGRAKKELINKIKKEKVMSYFHFIDRQPAALIPYYLAKFDFALVTLTKSEIFNQTIPAKIQSLMACGKPLVVSADGECQTIVEESQSGYFSDAGDVSALVSNIKNAVTLSDAAITALGNNSHGYYLKNFEKSMLVDKFEHIIRTQGSINHV
ncbi:glycosyltransferase family 4 protein [Fundicoccus sp. Sow4_F4]|uniref:glycosyltransferase family 4 protein n=1 Tax=Fundicoccus sp. Sow4_F4 TaxID=3438783 RepID=UPI003F924331